MNESEVEEHRIESGEEFLLITAKVIFFCSCESESGRRNQRIEIGEKFLLITAKVIFFCRCESERGESESGRGKAKDRRCFC